MVSKTLPDPGPMRPDTRGRILEAAERLFADRGFAGTSLRSIVAAADVNLAAVHYHFGSKEALIHEVFSSLVAPMNEERMRRLERLEARAKEAAEYGRGTGTPRLEEVIEAFVGPALEMARDSALRTPLLRLLGRIHTDVDEETDAALMSQFRAVGKRFGEALCRILPEVGNEEIYWRLHFSVGSLIYTVAFSHRVPFAAQRPSGAGTDADLEMTKARLIRFLAAGMRAGTVGGGTSGGVDA